MSNRFMPMRTRFGVLQFGIVVLSLLTAGCGSRQEEHGMTSRFGAHHISVYTVDDKSAKYDVTTHILRAPAASLQVYFPSEPSAIPRTIDLNDNGQIVRDARTYSFLDPGENFDLMITDLTVLPAETDDRKRQEDLNSYCTIALHELNFSESSRHSIKSPDNKLEGIEAEGRLPKGLSMFRLQMFLTKEGECYKLIAVGPYDQITGAEANRFFNSFQPLKKE